MKIEKIYYQQKFPTVQYGNVDFGMEIILEKGDTIADAFTRGHKESNENFNRLFPQGMRVQPESTDFNTGEVIRLMQGKKKSSEADKEWDDFKKLIDMAQTEEAANKLLAASSYKYSIEAKKYIHNKFNPNGKK